MPRLAANLGMMFPEYAFPDRFQAAARAGFEAVELLFPYEHTAEDVARYIADAGLRNLGLNLWPGDWSKGERGLAALPGREADFRSALTRALEYAEASGTPTIHAMCGIVPTGANHATCRAVYLDNLRLAARAAAAQGRRVMIEAINPRDMPGYFLTTQAEAHAIREELGEPNLHVQMDFYHCQVVEGDLTKTFLRYQPHIAHVQIAGVPDRHEPDEGEVNFAHILRMLDASGYTGWVGCEYRPRAGTEAGLGWLRTLTETRS